MQWYSEITHGGLKRGSYGMLGIKFGSTTHKSNTCLLYNSGINYLFLMMVGLSHPEVLEDYFFAKCLGWGVMKCQELNPWESFL